jgi:hypothetical protein
LISNRNLEKEKSKPCLWNQFQEKPYRKCLIAGFKFELGDEPNPKTYYNSNCKNRLARII